MIMSSNDNLLVIIPLLTLSALIFLSGLTIISIDKTIICRECPYCHTIKTIRFSLVGAILLFVSTFLGGIIYICIKLWQCRCEKCFCFTQRIIIMHNRTAENKKEVLEVKKDK